MPLMTIGIKIIVNVSARAPLSNISINGYDAKAYNIVAITEFFLFFVIAFIEKYIDIIPNSLMINKNILYDIKSGIPIAFRNAGIYRNKSG